MGSKPLYSAYPHIYENTPEFKALNNIFVDSELKLSSDAVIARGGFDFWPALGIALAFTGTAYASGFIGSIASEHYKVAKKLIKKAIREIRPPRHQDWPANMDIQTSQFCGLTLQIKTSKHSFIVDFHIPSLESLDKALDALPEFLESLASNSTPTHHLILWDGQRWKITLTQTLDPSTGFVKCD